MADQAAEAVWLKLGAEPGLCAACQYPKLNQTRRGTGVLALRQSRMGQHTAPVSAPSGDAVRRIRTLVLSRSALRKWLDVKL